MKRFDWKKALSRGVVTLLCLFLVGGVVWGADSVLGMEGTAEPYVPAESASPYPSDAEAVAYMPHNILDPLSVALIPKFQKLFKNNNKRAVVWLRMWDLFATLALSGLGWFFVDKRWTIIAIYAVFYGLNGLNNGPSNVFEGELGREINDYTEYMTGERPDGTFNILTDLITKVTSPLNALLTIKLFKWTGYDSTIPMLPWSQGSKLVYQKVFFLFVGIGLLPHFVRIIPYFFYDLVGEKREQMYIRLNERRALIAKENEKNKEIEKMVEMLEGEET